MRKVAIRLAVSVAIAAILIHWLVSQGFEVLPSWNSIVATVSTWALPTYVGLFVLFHFLRAWRWSYLLGPFVEVQKRTMLEVAFLGFVAIQMMPSEPER